MVEKNKYWDSIKQVHLDFWFSSVVFSFQEFYSDGDVTVASGMKS